MSREEGAPSLLFAGGGTGGHLFPALAIAEEVRRLRPDARIAFAGTKRKLESRVVPAHGYAFHAIRVRPIPRKPGFSLLLVPFLVAASVAESAVLLRRLGPDVVVGTGGYVAGPVVCAAWLAGLPTLLQEQNGAPGVTTRLMASRATEVHLAFARARRFLRRQDNIRITGTPVRAEVGAVDRAG
ncbi:MAG: glycosyltransferase, partial [Bacteroidota bacterium]